MKKLTQINLNINYIYYIICIMDTLINIYAGAFSGLIEGVVTHPIDLIKIKMQNNKLNNMNMKKTALIRNIWKTQGIRGFYQGITPKLSSVIPIRILYWGALNKINRKLYNPYDTSTQKFIKLSLAGTIAGFSQSLIDNPVEVMKIQIMTNKNYNTKQLIKNIIKTYPGPGFSLTLYRNSLFAVGTSIGVYWKHDSSPSEQFMYGAIGGLIGCVISQPLDYAKTDNQRFSNKTGKRITMIDLCTLMKKDPMKLWTGGSMRALLGFCSMGIGAVCFKQIYDAIYDYEYSKY